MSERPKTVRDLIAVLQTMDPDALVLVDSDGIEEPWGGEVVTHAAGWHGYDAGVLLRLLGSRRFLVGRLAARDVDDAFRQLVGVARS